MSRANRQATKSTPSLEPPADAEARRSGKPVKPSAKLITPDAVRPKTANQGRYLRAIDESVVTFGLGPAGSGKTFLAVSKGVQALHNGSVERIVLTRPYLGLGPTMGFQPGDLLAKIRHFIEPMLEALEAFYTPPQIEQMIRVGTIKVVAFEFIRGRTFKDSFVILDEAQNATHPEMKAFLTRIGEGSRYVINGDLSRDREGYLEQCDLPQGKQGALERAADRFADLPGVSRITMNTVDIVRHPLVRAMLERGF